MIVVETKRLCIRKITKEDNKDLLVILADPIVMKYSTVGVHSKKQISEYIERCQEHYDLYGYGHWAIYSKSNGEFIGVCGLNKHEINNENIIHVNYRIATHQQGKGYATESTSGVLDFARSSLKLDVIYALIEPENTNSVKIAHRAGFKYSKPSVFRGFTIDVYQKKL